MFDTFLIRLVLNLVLQDWRWAVGCHPFSSTASGWSVSLFHSDAIMRSYIVTTLDESIESMNEAIKQLAKEPTCILSLGNQEILRIFYTLLEEKMSL
jgi:hypothetical protein